MGFIMLTVFMLFGKYDFESPARQKNIRFNNGTSSKHAKKDCGITRNSWI